MDSVLLGSLAILSIGIVSFLAIELVRAKSDGANHNRGRKEEERREQVINVISHQLRTPLSIVRGYLDALGSEDLGKLNVQQKEYVSEAAHINEKMIDMVNKYVEVLNQNSDAIAVTKKPVDLVMLLQKTAKHFTGYATASNASFQLRLPKKPLVIQTDETVLQSIIDTLVQNSMKYSAGSTTITLELQEQPASVIMTVQDTGMGIPKEQQQEVFGKFFRGKNILHRSIAGSGLGLFVAKTYAEALGGSIHFESEESKGTTMHVTIPRA